MLSQGCADEDEEEERDDSTQSAAKEEEEEEDEDEDEEREDSIASSCKDEDEERDDSCLLSSTAVLLASEKLALAPFQSLPSLMCEATRLSTPQASELE
jgi:hypothetical protein